MQAKDNDRVIKDIFVRLKCECGVKATLLFINVFNSLLGNLIVKGLFYKNNSSDAIQNQLKWKLKKP